MYFLENTKGEILRTLDWQDSEYGTLHLLQRHDTGRVETTNDLSILIEQNIQFTLIKSWERNQIDEKFFQAAGFGSIRLVSKANKIVPSVQLQEDDEEKFVLVLKRTAAACVLIASIVTGMSIIIGKTTPEDQELRVVEIFERPKPIETQTRKIEKTVVDKRIVAPSKRKATIRIAKSPTLRKSISPKNRVSINQTGALSALGSLTNSKQIGGLNLNKVNSSAGIGRGGSQGSGGMQTSIYAKGLVSAPLGNGQKADGAGGYGTRGKGGGQAGYGKISLVGSGGSFFHPIESDTLIEGGLDRNEIAAVIQRHLSEVRFCYEQGLQQKPNLSGRVSMKFLISPTGAVSTANVSSSSLSSSLVEGCIRDRLKTWIFPQPRGGVNVKVSYPFVLRRVTET